MDDIGHAVHYTAVPAGTTVYGSDGERAGTVEVMLDNYREHIFDGIVIETTGGERKFVDAPEVARTAERAVTLTIPTEEMARLGPPPSRRGGGGGGLFGTIFGKRGRD
jgi:hypothetical protein